MARRKAGDSKVAVGNVTGVSGKVTIAGGDIYEGLSVQDVSLLVEQITTDFQRRPFDGRCPYKGLEVFEEQDADLFFGRERLVQDLLGRLKESRTVFITGPSGSGKSSLVRAGLLHALKKGAMPGSESWLYETLKPGREPLKEVSLAFSRLKSPELADYFQAHANDPNILNKCAESALSGHKDQRFILFIDQFEEIFTQVNQEEERRAFIHMLAHAGTLEEGRVTVLFAMRSDFVSNCAAYSALNELLSHEFRQIGAMQPDELVSAIALPARHVGLPVEDELVARIINDMRGEPGALPLMQFALKDLFDSQQARGGVVALTLEDYLRHGGIRTSLERHADASLAALDEEQQQLARTIFSGLIEVGRGTQDTKRTALFEELVPAGAQAGEVAAIVQRLADARLIITDEQAGRDTITISHEKLIDAWPWLKKLVNENRDAIALQNEIARDAKEWEDHQRDPSYLYTGARLAGAREKLAARKIVLSGLAQAFIEAGVKEYADDLEAARQRSAQLRRRSRILAAALAAALIAVGLAVFLGFRIREEARLSRIRELAAQAVALRDRNFPAALLLGVEAFNALDNVQTRSALMTNTFTNPSLEASLSGMSSSIETVAFSPDGRLLASGSIQSGAILLWDLDTRQVVARLRGHSETVTSIAFSPDGSLLASGSGDSTIRLWDVASAKPVGQLLKGHSDWVECLAFSPDGRMLASGGRDNTILLWDLGQDEPASQLVSRQESDITSVSFHPGGELLAASDYYGNISLWDVETAEPAGDPFVAHDDVINSIAFSPDGTFLASGGDDNRVILWDAESWMPIHSLEGHNNDISQVAFSPDSRLLASAGGDNSVVLWDVETGAQVEQLRGHSAWVNSVAFSPDGTRLASGGDDGALILWNLEEEQTLGETFGYWDWIYTLAFSPDGKLLATGGYDPTVLLWDVHTREPVGEFSGHTDAVNSVAFSPDGRILAAGSWDSTILLWEVETGNRIAELRGHSDWVDSIAFSPDGTLLASASNDGSIRLWDVKTGKTVGQPLLEHSSDVNSVAFSPDGRILASGGDDRTILLWDVKTWTPIHRLRSHSEWISSLAFSPDGRTLASGSGDETILLWDVETGTPVGQPWIGHSNWVDSVAFSPDGSMLASASLDGSVILWDIATGEILGQQLTGHSDWVDTVAFHPDGHVLASAGFDSTVMLWDTDPASWVRRVCDRAGRNFTTAEWERFFPGQDYRATCEQYPRDASYYREVARQSFSESGDSPLEQAYTRVREEMEKDPAIQDAITDSAVIMEEVVQIRFFAEKNADNWPEALALISQVKTSDLLLLQNPNFLNDTLCWDGSLEGFAAQVLEYCELAVDLVPDDPYFRDSRGLARALTGDPAGAIEDFHFFLENSEDEEMILTRQQWIADLEQGKDPFTPEVLAELQSE